MALVTKFNQFKPMSALKIFKQYVLSKYILFKDETNVA